MAKIEYQATALPGSGNNLFNAAFNAYANAGKNFTEALGGLAEQGQDWRDTQLNQFIASQYDANNLNSINEAIKNAATNPAFANASAKAWENINKERANWNTGLNTDNLAQDEVRVASANNAMQAAVNTAMTPNDIRYANDLIKGAVATNPNSRALNIPEANKVNELLLNGKAQRAHFYASAKRMADEDKVYDCADWLAQSIDRDLSNAQEKINQATSMWDPKTVRKATEKLGYPLGIGNRVGPFTSPLGKSGKTPMTVDGNGEGKEFTPTAIKTSTELFNSSNTQQNQTVGKNTTGALTPRLNVEDLTPNANNNNLTPGSSNLSSSLLGATSFNLDKENSLLPGSVKLNKALYTDNNVATTSALENQEQVVQNSVTRALQDPTKMSEADANNLIEYMGTDAGKKKYNDNLLFKTLVDAAMPQAERFAQKNKNSSSLVNDAIQQSSPKAQALLKKVFYSIPQPDYTKARTKYLNTVGNNINSDLTPEEYQRTYDRLYGKQLEIQKAFNTAYNAEDGQVKNAVEELANSNSIPENKKPQLITQIVNTYLQESAQKLNQENNKLQKDALTQAYPNIAPFASDKMFESGNIIASGDALVKNVLNLDAVEDALDKDPTQIFPIAKYVDQLTANNNTSYTQFFHGLTTMPNGADDNFIAQENGKSSNKISDYGLLSLSLSGNDTNNIKAFTEGYPLSPEQEKTVGNATTLYGALERVFLSEGLDKSEADKEDGHKKVVNAINDAIHYCQYSKLPPFVVAQAASKFVSNSSDTLYGSSYKFNAEDFGKYIKNLETVSKAIKSGNYNGLNESQLVYAQSFENIKQLRQKQETAASYFGGANEDINRYNKKLQELATKFKNSNGYSMYPDQYHKDREELREIANRINANMQTGLHLFSNLK